MRAVMTRITSGPILLFQSLLNRFRGMPFLWRRRIAALYWNIPFSLRRLVWRGRRRYCGVCDSWSRVFLGAGAHGVYRPDAQCPVCGAAERHRAVWGFLEERRLLTRPLRFLHIAPERSLERRFRAIRTLEYISADLEDPHARSEERRVGKECRSRW